MYFIPHPYRIVNRFLPTCETMLDTPILHVYPNEAFVYISYKYSRLVGFYWQWLFVWNIILYTRCWGGTIMEAIIGKILSELGAFLFGPIMLAVFFGVGLYFTVRLKGIQFSRFSTAFREVVGNVGKRQTTALGRSSPTKPLPLPFPPVWVTAILWALPMPLR